MTHNHPAVLCFPTPRRAHLSLLLDCGEAVQGWLLGRDETSKVLTNPLQVLILRSGVGPDVLPFYKLLSNARPENYTSSSKALHCILPTSGVDEFSRAQLALTSLLTLLPNKHTVKSHCFWKGAVTNNLKVLYIWCWNTLFFSTYFFPVT